MRCKYCNERLGITKVLFGQSFCSEEHQQLYNHGEASESVERLRASFADPLPKKPLTPKPSAPEQAPAAETAQTGEKTETTEQVQEVAEKAQEVAEKAEPEAAPSIQIASLADALENSRGSELPRGPFSSEPGSSSDEPRAPGAITDAEEPMFAAVRSPEVHKYESAEIETAPAIPSVSRLAPPAPAAPSPAAPSPADVLSVLGQASWLSVPEGYPPVVVSDSATLVLDSSPAQFITIPIGEPCPGDGPAFPQASGAIEPPSRYPALPSWETRPSQADGSSFIAPPPQSSARDLSGKPVPGKGPGELSLAGPLIPEGSVPEGILVRLGPLPMARNWQALPGFQSVAAKPRVGAPPMELYVAPAPLPAAIVPRRILYAGEPATPRVLALATAPSPLAPARDVILPSRSDVFPSQPNIGESSFAWLTTEVASRLPEISGTRPQAPTGLPVASDCLPLMRSKATNYPATRVEPVAEAALTPAVRLLPSTRLRVMPAMPRSTRTRPLFDEARRLPASTPQRQWAANAYLHPSLPSPWSLVTWSRSISVSIPARVPSNLETHAPLALTPIVGRVQSLRPLSASRRQHRLIPLMPEAGGPAWSHRSPSQALLLEPTIEPVRPGSQGTGPLHISKVRVQPASMPALPLAQSHFQPVSWIGLTPSGLVPGAALRLASRNLGHSGPDTYWELITESGVLLPEFSAGPRPPRIGPAPGRAKVSLDPIPPQPIIGAVDTFSSLQRLVWSLSTQLPAAAPPTLRPV